MKKNRLFSGLVTSIFIILILFPTQAHAGWLDDIKQNVTKVYENAKSVVKTTVDTVKHVAGVAIDTAKSIAENVTNVVKKTAETVYETAKSAIKSVVSTVTGIGKETKKVVKDGIDKVNESAEKLTKDLPKQAAIEINNAIESVKKFISGKKQDFEEFKKVIEKFKDEGIDLIQKAKAEGEEKIIHPVIARIQEDAKKVHEVAKQKITDFSSVIKNVSSKGLDFAKDKIGPLVEKDKNSIAIASIMKELKNSKGNLSLANSFSLGSASFNTKADIKGHARGDISVHELLVTANAHLGPRFTTEGSAKFFGGKISANASSDTIMGVFGQSEGNIKLLKNGALVDAKGAIGVGAGIKSVQEAQITMNTGGGFGNKTSLNVESLAGAEAGAEGKVYLGKNGIELKGKAEARCGAWVEGSFNHAARYKGSDLIGVGLGGGIGAGLSAGVQGGFSFKANKVGFQDVGFSIGPVKIKGSFYVNPVGIAEMAVDKGREIAQHTRQHVENIKDKGKELLEKVGNKLVFWE